MHEVVLHVAVCWLRVGLSCETHETLFVYKNSKGSDTGQQHVDSQIEFEAV